MAPQWGVLPSNDQTPSTIKSGTHHNPITLQPREYSSANEKTWRGCVLDVRNGKSDIYRHKKPIIEVLEDSGGRRGGQWGVLCLKSFMTSAAVLLTWVTYGLWHVEYYCDWSLLFWHVTTSHVLPHTWIIWQILFDICEASIVYVPCQHQSSRHFATERSGQMQMQMARWPDDQMSSARWPDVICQTTRCHLPDDSCFDKKYLGFAKLSEDALTCRPNLTPTNVWLLSKFSNNACCIINCKILGLQIWKVTILMHYVFESNCETMCAVFVQYVDSHT